MNYSIIELFDGNVGNVLKSREFNNMFGDFVCGNEIELVEYFDFSGGELFLNKSNGYRGYGCYEGVFVKDNKKYYVDIVNEGIVCDVE